MIYTEEQLKDLVRPMITTALKDDDRPKPVIIEELTDAIIEVVKQDRDAHANNPNTEMAANDD